MIPRVAKPGSSFKGLIAYMSHDPDKARSSDRLGFVDLVNLDLVPSTDRLRDIERAGAIMAWTATHQIEIAELHHQRTSPGTPFKRPKQPTAKPVYSLSLRFVPEDAHLVTDALLRRAADGALKTLGMDKCQAIVLQHHDFTHTIARADIAATPDQPRYVPDDLIKLAARQHAKALQIDPGLPTAELRAAMIKAMTPTPEQPRARQQIDVRLLTTTPYTPTPAFPRHGPHVHVIVNLVDPTTGKAVRTSNDFLKLSRFAQAFSREHGLRPIATRIENNAKRDRGEIVRYKEIPRTQWALLKTYRGKTRATVERERLAQQHADIDQLDDRHRDASARLYREIVDPWRADRARHQTAQQALRARMSPTGTFAIAVKLTRKLIGQDRADARQIAALAKSISNIDLRIAEHVTSLEAAQAADRARLARRHAAELARDALYFEVLRRREDEDDRARKKNLKAQQRKAARDQGRATLPNLVRDLGGDPTDSQTRALGGAQPTPRTDVSDTTRRMREDMAAADKKRPRNPDRPHRPRKKKRDDDTTPDPDRPRRRR